ncbi:Tol-Pal system protein TolB [Phaeovibrio sulfidiphilus]|uniref:Tol-Pal system protein TolB n=1 Tax=Phaeovibrio sulfidiphilus TaxID=1220600 RepID=A0A8J6YWZ7_9PROT|nr:Tol-Pal system beta propeller repeat protein TolB [Phaeovibrio sulfidiphilus]MBE1236233.1 Tol-Pal system protein TolB [Phaeovibrio sulfidiphilus]
MLCVLLALCATAVLLPAGARTALAQDMPTVYIDRHSAEALPIAVPAFAGGADPLAAQTGSDIANVITNDLNGSGDFRVIDRNAYVETLPSMEAKPNFPGWRALSARALVQGEVSAQPDGRLKVAFRLWDTGTGEQIVGRSLMTQQDNWRRVAHIIADEIYKAITGEAGYFDSRIVYVAESGPKNNRVKRLAIMDQDGANNRILTSGDSLVLTPRFSPTSQEITYLSYYNNTPRVYLFNIETGRREMLGDFPGMTFAPRFSPDGNKIVLSMAKDGRTDIWVMDLRSRQSRKLTDTPYIDTSPSYSPDGQRIVFNSDRSGAQQLYIMNADGSNQQRISFGSGRYATPVWSPRGDFIAFTKMKGGRFYIGVMRPDGGDERILSEGYLVEGPSWSPNGRVLTFFRQEAGAGVRVCTIDLTGRVERVVPTPTEASDPAWSPILP